jgi:hypothetical protein
LHEFHLGQTVAYNPRKGTWAVGGGYLVAAKLPERDGEFESRIRNAVEEHERIARGSEHQAMSKTGPQPGRSPPRRS